MMMLAIYHVLLTVRIERRGGEDIISKVEDAIKSFHFTLQIFTNVIFRILLLSMQSSTVSVSALPKYR